MKSTHMNKAQPGSGFNSNQVAYQQNQQVYAGPGQMTFNGNQNKNITNVYNVQRGAQH